MEDVKSTSVTFAQRLSEVEDRAVAAEQRLAETETELAVEREWRESLQEKQLEYKEQIANSNKQIKLLKDSVDVVDSLKDELNEMHNRCEEADRTMEELGIQLSGSKLKISELEEEKQYLLKKSMVVVNEGRDTFSVEGANAINQSCVSGNATPSNQSAGRVNLAACGIWAPDSIASHCASCCREFNLTRRKHHCRSCGEIFCNNCSEHTLPMQLGKGGQLSKPVRVCSSCYELHK